MTAFLSYVLRLGDDALVLGHRLSEWCGHGPMLEEDVALANISLDLIGRASRLFDLAARTEGQGRDANAFAYFRDALEFNNHPLVELPNGDYAFTMMRQFLFDAYSYQVLTALQSFQHEELSGIATKAVKECAYHLRHSSEWVVRFGDGTEESRRRVQSALEETWRLTGTLFLADATDEALRPLGAPVPSQLEGPFRALVDSVLQRATLAVPSVERPLGKGYRRGEHTEHLGHMLAEMQSVARAHPGAKW